MWYFWKVKEDDKEYMKYIEFIKWMKEQGSNLAFTRIALYEKDYRGLHATVNIPKQTEILSVPLSLAISALNFEHTELGRTIMNKKLFDTRWEIFIYPLIYILEELDNLYSKHKAWLNILPDNADNHPAFFSEAELDWFKGSPLLEQLMLDKQLIQHFYDKISTIVPDFSKRHSLRKFMIYYYVLCSRFFGLSFYNPRLAFIVAYADMANTDAFEKRNAVWDCDKEKKYFRLVSLKPIKSGDPVHFSSILDCPLLRP